jgi:hypothetical protein
MKRSQLDLSLRVLRKMHALGVLGGVVIVGSWCLYFYRYHFHARDYLPDVRTRDIDFLVPLPPKFKQEVDLPAELESLGFMINFRGDGGYIRLDHPELIVEFLIPEIGRGRDKPYPLPSLGLNAQPLRYLNFLLEHTITVTFEEMGLHLPHPAAYALHKLIISGRRKDRTKAVRDRTQAIQLLHYLETVPQGNREITKIFGSMHQKWQRTVLDNLEKWNEEEILNLLRQGV